VIHAREDVGYVLPSLATVTPQEFFPLDQLRRGKKNFLHVLLHMVMTADCRAPLLPSNPLTSSGFS
jgi:hypothetical protein